MLLNYFLKGMSGPTSSLRRKGDEHKPKSIGFALVILMLLFASTSMKAQTQLIPVSDGAFSSGNTFAANGWTVANEGVGPVKWVVGTAVNSGAITGNSAYISLDNGETNSYVGISGARTVFFYRDIAIPAGQTNIALTFDWKSVATSGASWQVFAAPTSFNPVGLDTQSSVPATLSGATSITYGSINAVTQSALGFIPPSFAGTTVRLIFMWSNGSGGGTNPPASIDNISLVSRAGGAEIASVATGNFSNPLTWDAGYAPSPADDVVINAGHTVTIDNKNLGANNLYIAGAGAVIQFGALGDEFTVNNDLLISGSGARFNVYEGTTGKSLKVGHNIDLASGGRLDISVGSTAANAGSLNLFGSSLQTISSDGTGIVGGTVSSTTTTNTVGIINQLVVNNTSTAIPNIDWQLNNVRIKSILRLNSAKIGLGSNKIYIGNFASMSSSNFTCALGNGFVGGEISRWYGTSAMGAAIDPGIDYNPNSTVLFPFLSATGQNRWAFLINSGATTAGELAMTYADANTIATGLSVADGSYTITERYNGNWTVSKTGSTYVSTGTYALGLYAVGAYNALDGSSRIMKAGSVSGTHVNGTTSPFVARKGITDADLTTGAFYVGVGSASVQGAVTKTSAASGDWNNAVTWSPSGVPGCNDIVTIASGHTVTVNSAGNNAGGITINSGGTLINASGSLTVGCTNNNAVFANGGTNTVSGGLLTINGSVTHKSGSTFNHTGGDIVVDSNNAGDAATSVGQGGSSFKLNTSNLNLTGGKITIVDPLVNNTVATSATSGSDFTLTTLTLGTTGSFTHGITGSYNAGATVLTVSSFNSNVNIFGVGQQVSGPGIQPGTTITAITSLVNITITLSLPVNATISSPTLTFSSMSNGQYNIAFPTTGDFYNLAVGQLVSGPGIQPGTTIVSAGGGIDGKGGITLSLPVSGLATSPINADQAITLSAISNGCASVILSAANPAIIVGQAVAGNGIQPGTTVTAISGVKIDMSLPVSGTVTPPVNLTFYDGNLNSYAFAYNAPVNYAAGLNHTLQIGDGVSTDKGAVTINGYYCNLAQGGGILSLGNLTVDALDGTNRFFNAVNALFIQNATTVTTGSVFKKTNTTTGICFGGNVINNGSVFVGVNSIYLASAYNTTTFSAVPTTLPQTISGTGIFYNNLNSALATGSVNSLTVNNTNSAGVTIGIPNFRVSNGITMTAGIIHTSAATPLYHGVTDLSMGASVTGNFGPTCYIDGPYVRTYATNATSTNLSVCPVGKTSYTPISMGVTGGGIFTFEAFNTNTGTASSDISNLSTTRWKVTRQGTSGNFTDFRAAVGEIPVTAADFIVQATADQGTYDNVFGNTSVFTPATATSVNTIAMPVAVPGSEFTGNFAYATAANCTAVNPGNTIADLTITQTVALQNSSSTGITAGSVTVTLQTANAAIAVGLTVSGSGIPAGTTVAAISGTTLTLSQQATLSSTSLVPLTFSLVQTPTTLCGTQTVVLSLQNPQVGSGITYQWQASTDGGSNYADIPDATTAVYIATPTADTYYRCKVTCSSGPLVANSTPVEVTFTNAIDSTTADEICGAGVASLEATTSTGTINWYAAPSGGEVLATGNTYSPDVTETTTYYVSTESSSTYTAGKPFAGTGTQTAPFSGLVFNTSTKVRLNSVKVYPKQTAGAADAGAPITIKLFDRNGVQVPGTTAVTFTPSVNTGTVSTLISNTVVLNYDIPAGTGYRLLATNGLSSTNVLGRLSSSPAATPTVTGAIGITGSLNSFDGTPDASYNNFFDWNVTEVCASPRVAVVATVNPITTNTTTISACDSYMWSENGTTYTSSGTYTSTTGCNTETLELTIVSSTANTTIISACDTYTWSVNGTAYTSSGTYTSTTGCHTETLELTINSAATPTGNATQVISVTDLNDATIEDLVVSPADVIWYGSLTDAQGQLNPLDITTVLTNGATYYAVNVSSGCPSTPFAVTVTVALDAAGFDSTNFNFYPNPTSGILNINYSDAITNVSVMNLVGQLIMEKKANQSEVQVDLSLLPASAYFVKVESNGKSKVVKVIKQN